MHFALISPMNRGFHVSPSLWCRSPPLCQSANSLGVSLHIRPGGPGPCQRVIRARAQHQHSSDSLSCTFTEKMTSVRAACLLCAALFAMVRGFTHEDMKDALLKKLGLNEVPQIHKRDLENLVIPVHVKNKYISMLKLHHSRKRRSLPSLAGILRGIPGNAGKITELNK